MCVCVCVCVSVCVCVLTIALCREGTPPLCLTMEAIDEVTDENRLLLGCIGFNSCDQKWKLNIYIKDINII